MEKKEKRILLYIIIAGLLFVAVTHLELMWKFLGYLGDLIMPVAAGLIIAFILNVPVSGFEQLFGRISAKHKRKPSNKMIHLVSIVLTIICLFLLIFVLGTLVIPQLVCTAKSIAALIESNWPAWLSTLERYNIDTTGLKRWVSTFDWQSIIKSISGYAGILLGSIANVATTTVSGITTLISAIIIAMYSLLDRDKLAQQSKRLLYAYAKPKVADEVCYIAALTKHVYTKFLAGQCVESIILGVLITITFSIFRLPYAGLIGVVTAICALIPYIGALLSCGLSVVLALLISPKTAIMCLVVYLAVQFIETQFIYPRVVGGSVGLSPMWTLIAVLIGGKLLGLIGMIFFIPLVSVIYVLVKEDVQRRQSEQQLL